MNKNNFNIKDKNKTFYNLNQIIENDKGWLFYDAALKNWKSMYKRFLGNNILDLGCGSGISIGINKVFDPQKNFVGFEGDKKLNKIWELRKVNVITGDIYKLPFKNNQFDTVYSSHVLEHLKYPKTWWNNISNNCLTNKWEDYDKEINKYKVKVGTTLEYWEDKNWILHYHPYGWVQWYCDFYYGKRCEDDERQINRWIKTAGSKSRFRRALINLIIKNNSTYNDFTISPKRRQTLQHWGYILTKKDCK